MNPITILFKKWLKDNDIEIHSKCNERKSVVAERFIRTLKIKIYKHMTAVSKNGCFDLLDNIVDKCNNTYYNNRSLLMLNLILMLNTVLILMLKILILK